MCQIIHTLLAQINALQLGDILRRRLANSLHDNSGVRFEDDTVVDDFVDCEGDEVVVLDDGAFVY